MESPSDTPELSSGLVMRRYVRVSRGLCLFLSEEILLNVSCKCFTECNF